MGHVDTPAAQSAHMLRCRHGSSTTALGRSRQTTHDGSSPSPTAGGGGSAGSLRAGSALHSPTPDLPSVGLTMGQGGGARNPLKKVSSQSHLSPGRRSAESKRRSCALGWYRPSVGVPGA